MAQKKAKILERQNEVINGLHEFGSRIYSQLDQGVFPTIEMPSRGTDNIAYDPTLRQYILGERNVSRSARNIRHIKPFTQLAWAAMFSNELNNPTQNQHIKRRLLFGASLRNDLHRPTRIQ